MCIRDRCNIEESVKIFIFAVELIYKKKIHIVYSRGFIDYWETQFIILCRLFDSVSTNELFLVCTFEIAVSLLTKVSLILIVCLLKNQDVN